MQPFVDRHRAMILRHARGVVRAQAEKIAPEDVAREVELELGQLAKDQGLAPEAIHAPDAYLRVLVRHALGRARRRRTLIDQLAAGDDLDALSSDLTALDADLPPPPAPPSDDGVKARAALDAAKAKLAPRDALVLALLFEDAGSMDDVAEALAMPMEDVAAARERVLEAAGGEGALRGLGDRADATKIETPHADEPVLALLRHGDHGDDLADAMAHVARCAECRARLVVGAVEGRSVVVVAIEAPRTSVTELARAADASQARLVARGHGRFTAVVDVSRAEQLKTDLAKEQSQVARLVVSGPLKVPREEPTLPGRRPMPSLIDFTPAESGTDAAEVQAWVQMRRVPRRKVRGGSPGWALFAIAAVLGAIAIAYFLAIR